MKKGAKNLRILQMVGLKLKEKFEDCYSVLTENLHGFDIIGLARGHLDPHLHPHPHCPWVLPQGVANLDSRDLIGRIYVVKH